MSIQMRTPRFHQLVVALGVALVAGPAAAQTAAPKAPATQTAGPKAAIEAANAKFSADFAKGDVTAVASHYTAAAWAFPPNGDITRGREAIGKLWKGAMDGGVKEAKLTTVEVEARGDTAHEIGTYVLIGEGGKTVDTGKYVVVWKRQGRQWKIHRDIWNTSMPAPK
jgi:ketosteroid isomerase-like protein